MKFPQLCVSPGDFMNPDTTVGGFPAFLGLVQQVQCTLVISAMIDVEREQVEKYRFKNEQASTLSFFPPERQAQEVRMTRMKRIVQNDQVAQY